MCGKVGIKCTGWIPEYNGCPEDLVVQIKSTCAIDWIVNWNTCFSHGTPFILEKMTDRQTMVTQT